MKNLICLIYFLIGSIFGYGQFTIDTITIHSEFLGGDRAIWICLPSFYELRNDHYDVIYLLDGQNESLLRHTISSKRFIEENATDLTDYNSDHAIIIGVESKQRHIDFGKGKLHFENFLIKEVKKYVADQYRTSGYDVLVGHSLAGRFALSTLVHHPETFDAFITASPAINATKSEDIIGQIDSILSARNLTLFNSITLLDGERTEEAFRPFSSQLEERIKISANLNKGIRFNSATYKMIGHSKSPYFAIPEGLRFIFSGEQWDFTPHEKAKIFRSDLSIETIVQSYRQRIQMSRRNEGVRIPDRWVGAIVYAYKETDNEAAALELLDKSVAINPTNLKNYILYLDMLKSFGDRRYDGIKSSFLELLDLLELDESEHSYWIERSE